MTIQEEAGKVATSAIDAFKAQPGLLFLTIINIAFLVFVYFMGTLVLAGYLDEQKAVRDRYTIALRMLDRCFSAGLENIEHAEPGPPAERGREPR